MTHTEFVIDVGIENGQIGDGVFAEREALEHRLVDDPSVDLLVGAHRIETNVADRRLGSMMSL